MSVTQVQPNATPPIAPPNADQQGQGTATHETPAALATGAVSASAATQSASAQQAAAIVASDAPAGSAPITSTLTPAELGEGGIASIYPPLDYPPLFPPIVSPLHGIVKADASLSALPTVASSVAPAVNASA